MYPVKKSIDENLKVLEWTSVLDIFPDRGVRIAFLPKNLKV